MTTAVQVDPYQVDQQQGLTDGEEAALVALALFFASVTAVNATLLPALLVRRLTGLGLSARAVQAAGRLTLEPALTGRTRWGSPTVVDEPAPNPFGLASARRFGPPTMVKRMAANEPTMRARYLLAAAKRLTRAAAEGRFTAGLRREQTYLAAHRRAGQRRAKAARAYDVAAHGQLFMVWVTAGDSRVDPHCAALAGSVWSVDRPPVPCPGAVHPWCRCVARPLGSHSAAAAA
jgi:hypothetical protein